MDRAIRQLARFVFEVSQESVKSRRSLKTGRVALRRVARSAEPRIGDPNEMNSCDFYMLNVGAHKNCAVFRCAAVASRSVANPTRQPEPVANKVRNCVFYLSLLTHSLTQTVHRSIENAGCLPACLAV